MDELRRSQVRDSIENLGELSSNKLINNRLFKTETDAPRSNRKTTKVENMVIPEPEITQQPHRDLSGRLSDHGAGAQGIQDDDSDVVIKEPKQDLLMLETMNDEVRQELENFEHPRD
jgi:hypothetical protein